MSDYYIHFEGSGMPSKNCPECGEYELEYYDTDIEGATDGILYLRWECRSCGTMGRDEFSLNFDARYVDNNATDAERVIWAR